MRPLELVLMGATVVFGLVVAASGGLVLRRSKHAAGFVALAGLGYVATAMVSIALRWVMRGSHMPLVGTQLLFTTVALGRSVIFYGGLVLALRALAQSSGDGQ